MCWRFPFCGPTDQYLTVSSRVQPTKLITTRCRIVLAKRKSANALSGEMPWNSPLFCGFIWIRRQTAQQRENERSEITKRSHGGKHSLVGAVHRSLFHQRTRKVDSIFLIRQDHCQGICIGLMCSQLSHSTTGDVQMRPEWNRLITGWDRHKNGESNTLLGTLGRAAGKKCAFQGALSESNIFKQSLLGFGSPQDGCYRKISVQESNPAERDLGILVDKNLTMSQQCCSPRGQLHLGLHQWSSQQVEGGYRPLLLCSHEAPLRILNLGLGPRK